MKGGRRVGKTLAEVLNGYLADRGWSFERLAEAAGLPRNTVYRWSRGEVRRVRHWHDLVRAAQALQLSVYQTNTLLETSGHPSVQVLLQRATAADDRALLAGYAHPPSHTLPVRLTRFFGRQEEVEELIRLLSSARLVTLTGPGGSGKTRLALEVAQALLDDFSEVAFVDLAAVHEPDQVVLAISQALGLRESLDEPPLLSLTAHLRDAQLLLVLDNVEQVIDAAPALVQLLWSTRMVRMLVTSRTRLNVRGEHEFVVYPLPLPGATSAYEDLAANPAVALFVDRARAADRFFRLDAQNAPLVAEVCARLDGLPLGIELAATKVRQMGLRSMLDRVPGRLELASGGPQDAHERQRTLRAAVAWSYDLLERGPQDLFTRLGVFANGFVGEAVRAVCGVVSTGRDAIADDLDTLIDQSLLRRSLSAGDEPRYEMLETFREYSLERLREAGWEQGTRQAHADYYLGLAERADLDGEAQASWLHRLAADHENIRAALDWCRERAEHETGLRLTVAMMPFWQLRDQQREAYTWLETFLTIEGTVPQRLRAKGLLWQGLLLFRGSGDDEGASRRFEEALVLFRSCGDLDGESETLQAEGDIFRNLGDWERAGQRFAGSLDLAERSGNAYLAAHGYMGLALCAQEEDRFEAAQEHWAMALERATQSGNRGSVALALNSLGEMARYREDWEEAEHAYDQALRLARELDSAFRAALALHNLGYVALKTGALGKARGRFVESLILNEGQQYRKGVAECLAGLGGVEAAAGRPERAALLCGAGEAILEELGTRLDTLDRTDYERTLTVLERELGDGLAALLDQGRAMPVATAVTFAQAGF